MKKDSSYLRLAKYEKNIWIKAINTNHFSCVLRSFLLLFRLEYSVILTVILVLFPIRHFVFRIKYHGKVTMFEHKEHTTFSQIKL